MPIIADLASGLSHLFYPRLCEGCSKPLLPEEDVLCLNCNVYYLPRTAYHHIQENESYMRLAGRFPLKKATSLAYFTDGGLLQHLMHQLKYNGKQHIGLYLGRQLGYDLQQTSWVKDIDVIIPVPLYKDKEAARGYNQAALITEGLSAVLQIPVLYDVLARVKATESQTQKTREERFENMQQAFEVVNPEPIQHKHILLVDDVLTTGATLEACALELQKQEGIRVSVATVGIAS